jgi:CheY-like chemotaxis protein
MYVLIASSSAFRRNIYQQAVENLRHEVTVVHGGVECIEQVSRRQPDVLMIEAPLLWGGADGVLDVLQASLDERRTKVIVLAVGGGSIDWLQLSRFRVDDVLFRVPTAPELRRTLGDGDGASALSRHLHSDHSIHTSREARR